MAWTALRRLGAARAGRRGAVVLEFGLTAAMFLGVVAFLADLGFVLYTQVALDFVASRAARLLAVDSQQRLSANQASFQSVTVCPLLAAFLACDQLTVTLSPVSDYASASTPPNAGPNPGPFNPGPFNPGPFNPGQGSSLMLLQLSYALPDFAAPLAAPGVFSASATVARFPYINEY